jgi:hypothetical protein
MQQVPLKRLITFLCYSIVIVVLHRWFSFRFVFNDILDKISWTLNPVLWCTLLLIKKVEDKKICKKNYFISIALLILLFSVVNILTIETLKYLYRPRYLYKFSKTTPLFRTMEIAYIVLCVNAVAMTFGVKFKSLLILGVLSSAISYILHMYFLELMATLSEYKKVSDFYKIFGRQILSLPHLLLNFILSIILIVVFILRKYLLKARSC